MPLRMLALFVAISFGPIARADEPAKSTIAFGTPAFKQWEQEVAKLSADERIAAVTRKLTELNPGYDGKYFRIVAERDVCAFVGVSNRLKDISPLAALRNLRSVRIEDDLFLPSDKPNRLSDLSPLRGLPLTYLSIEDLPVSDLSALRGMPLEEIELIQTKVADLSPLRGMPLTSLQCPGAPVSDLSPLYGCEKLYDVNLYGTKVTGVDVAGLQKALPQCAIDWDEPLRPITTLADPAFQKWLKEVAALPPARQMAAFTHKIAELNPNLGYDKELRDIYEDSAISLDGLSPWKPDGVVIDLGFFTHRITDLSPVRAFPGLKTLRAYGCTLEKRFALQDLSPLKGLPLTYLDINYTRVADLAPLAGMPLTTLDCSITGVSDLAPLKGAPLVVLDCGSTKVADLSPLKGMRLERFHCGYTPVADLSPLKGMKLTAVSCGRNVSDLTPLAGMPLTEIDFVGSKISDLSPLRGMTLTKVCGDYTFVVDLSPLRGMPLTEVSFSNTRVSDLSPLRGMDRLENVNFSQSAVVDVSPLKDCKSLKMVRLDSTKVTAADIDELHKALPQCDIYWDGPTVHGAK
ncbi:MAG: hypothetical protein K8U03_09890 [Planctomycetia bacterium]|nr:hypothetical protein [Planctomycetia bacterium]